MTRSLGIAIALGTALLWTFASADQPTIIPRIGVFSSAPAPPADEGLRDGLRELGYLEGKNINIEWRRSLGTEEELRSVASELAQARVGLIVVFSTLAARAALQATTIPVVFLAGDPLAAGLATSLAHPGGRGTGVSMLNTDLTGKRMELLQQVAPRIQRIILWMDPSNPLNTRVLEEAHKAARTLGVEVVTLGARNADELDAALHAMARNPTDGLLISNDLLLVANRAKVTRAVRKAKLPAIFPFKEYHEDGALMSYGPNLREAGRKIAIYVDKILKGANPSDLPVEQMSKHELIIDLRVARAMGIHVPQVLLQRADEVMK